MGHVTHGASALTMKSQRAVFDYQNEREVPGLIDDNPIDNEDFDDRLEDEDYDLLEGNLRVEIERKRRFKRLRRIQDKESEEQEKAELDDETDAIANELFQGSEEQDEKKGEVQKSPRGEFDEEESDEENDFIIDGDGIPITEKIKKKKPIFSDTALQDIFGIDFDYDEFGKYGENEFEEEEEEEEDEYIQDEIEDRRKRSKKNFFKEA